jgi:chromosome segregation ATPase
MADYGIPLADQTKLSGGFSTPPLPSTQPQLAPTQPPITAEAEQKARTGQQFAWAPDQNKQVTGIQDTRESEFRGRAARVAINQATEQTKAQTEQVKAQIVAVEGEIAQLNAQISDLNGQISGLSSQASSVEGQISSVQAEAQAAQAKIPAQSGGQSVATGAIKAPVAAEENAAQIQSLQTELERMKQQGKWRYDAGEMATFEGIKQQIRNLGGWPL